MKNSILSLLVMLITITVSAQNNYSINGNLGLDTIPENKLDVNGDAKFYGDVKVDNELFMDALKSTSPLFEQLVYIDSDGRMQRLGEGGARTVVEALHTLECRDEDEEGNPIPGIVYWQTNPGKITAYDANCISPNVGIGTDNPLAQLDVRGKVRFTEQLAIGGSNQGNSYLYVRSHPFNPSIVVKDFDEEIELFSVAADGAMVSANHEIKANDTSIPGLKIHKKEGNSAQYGAVTVVDDNGTKSFATYNENEAKDVFAVRGNGKIEIKAAELNQRVIEVKNSENDETFRLLSDGKLYLTSVHVRIPEHFPDYVFEPGYKLMPLNELERHIKEHQRLPNMPSAEEVAKNGVDLGEMNRLLVEKVEELTLYILEMEQRLKTLENK